MKALIVVDVQNDFCPGGSLAVPNGNEVVPIINKLLPKFDLVIFTMDWHTTDMIAFASSHPNKNPFDLYTKENGTTDVLWPDHCVANTVGAEIHKDINYGLVRGNFYIFKKGTEKDSHPYSGFGAKGLLEFLNTKGVTENYVTGLATDYCVQATALDSVKNGFDTYVVWDAVRGIASNLDTNLGIMVDEGVNIINSNNIK